MTSFTKTVSERWFSKAATSLFALSLACGAAAAQDVAIIQPGAPGEPAKELSAEEAAAIADTSYSRDDVNFMQDMIPHHQKAVDMAALVSERTNSEALVDIAGRIDASQADEIQFMKDWLAARGEDLPGDHAHHGTHMSHEMMGMASPEQLADLAAAEGVAFDELFLTLMIRHHEGALTMVDDLLDQPGSAYDPVLFEFIADIQNDQSAEIERMNEMLEGISSDPRAALSAGFQDAGEAISNLTKVATLPRPPGFFDPENPADIPPIIEPDDSEAAETDMADHDGHHDHHDHSDHSEMSDMDMAETADRDDDQSNEETQWGDRSPLLSFSNTDMAFAGDMLVVGNYHGFNIYTLVEDAPPQLISSVVCPG